jgi:hypothetical protein
LTVARISINTSKVLAALRSKSLKGKKVMTYNVGYSAPYAVYVHENLTANHPNGGQAKFLEQPMRAMRDDLAAIISRSLHGKNGLEEGLRRAGQTLLEASQALVPVDTGFLRSSGFVEVK